MTVPAPTAAAPPTAAPFTPLFRFDEAERFDRCDETEGARRMAGAPPYMSSSLAELSLPLSKVFVVGKLLAERTED